jgi:tetratricopeptide (TPR) repeat protein
MVLAAIAVAVTVLTATPDRITWERNYDKAIERARAEQKLIIADMFTDWCVLCKQMDAETFADRGLIAKMSDRYVWLKLNTETEEDGERLQRDFGIETYPTILVLDDQGDEVDRIERFLAPLQFEQTVESIIASPDSLANLRKAVQDQPNSVSVRYALAGKFLKQKNYLKAIAEFKKVVELDPENREGKTALSQYKIALCLAGEFRFNEALAQLDLIENSLPADDSSADVAVLKADIYHCCGRVNEARAVLQEYIKKYPANERLQQVKEKLAAIQAAK